MIYISPIVRQAIKKYMVLAVAPYQRSVRKGTPGPLSGITPNSHHKTLGYSTGRMLNIYTIGGTSGYIGICELRKEHHVVKILDLGALRN